MAAGLGLSAGPCYPAPMRAVTGGLLALCLWACGSDSDNTSAPPGSEKLALANVSYGGTDPYDITFALAGTTTVAKLTSVEIGFAGQPSRTYKADCSSNPWTNPNGGLVEIKTSSSFGIKYPCGTEEKQTKGLVAPSGGASADVTVTLKGVATDACPFSVSGTGKKR